MSVPPGPMQIFTGRPNPDAQYAPDAIYHYISRRSNLSATAPWVEALFEQDSAAACNAQAHYIALCFGAKASAKHTTFFQDLLRQSESLWTKLIAQRMLSTHSNFAHHLACLMLIEIIKGAEPRDLWSGKFADLQNAIVRDNEKISLNKTEDPAGVVIDLIGIAGSTPVLTEPVARARSAPALDTAALDAILVTLENELRTGDSQQMPFFITTLKDVIYPNLSTLPSPLLNKIQSWLFSHPTFADKLTQIILVLPDITDLLSALEKLVQPRANQSLRRFLITCFFYLKFDENISSVNSSFLRIFLLIVCNTQVSDVRFDPFISPVKAQKKFPGLQPHRLQPIHEEDIDTDKSSDIVSRQKQLFIIFQKLLSIITEIGTWDMSVEQPHSAHDDEQYHIVAIYRVLARYIELLTSEQTSKIDKHLSTQVEKRIPFHTLYFAQVSFLLQRRKETTIRKQICEQFIMPVVLDMLQMPFNKRHFLYALNFNNISAEFMQFFSYLGTEQQDNLVQQILQTVRKWPIFEASMLPTVFTLFDKIASMVKRLNAQQKLAIMSDFATLTDRQLTGLNTFLSPGADSATVAKRKFDACVEKFSAIFAELMTINSVPTLINPLQQQLSQTPNIVNKLRTILSTEPEVPVCRRVVTLWVCPLPNLPRVCNTAGNALADGLKDENVIYAILFFLHIQARHNIPVPKSLLLALAKLCISTSSEYQQMLISDIVPFFLTTDYHDKETRQLLIETFLDKPITEKVHPVLLKLLQQPLTSPLAFTVLKDKIIKYLRKCEQRSQAQLIETLIEGKIVEKPTFDECAELLKELKLLASQDLRPQLIYFLFFVIHLQFEQKHTVSEEAPVILTTLFCTTEDIEVKLKILALLRALIPQNSLKPFVDGLIAYLLLHFNDFLQKGIISGDTKTQVSWRNQLAISAFSTLTVYISSQKSDHGVMMIEDLIDCILKATQHDCDQAVFESIINLSREIFCWKSRGDLNSTHVQDDINSLNNILYGFISPFIATAKRQFVINILSKNCGDMPSSMRQYYFDVFLEDLVNNKEIDKGSVLTILLRFLPFLPGPHILSDHVTRNRGGSAPRTVPFAFKAHTFTEHSPDWEFVANSSTSRPPWLGVYGYPKDDEEKTEINAAHEVPMDNMYLVMFRHFLCSWRDYQLSLMSQQQHQIFTYPNT